MPSDHSRFSSLCQSARRTAAVPGLEPPCRTDPSGGRSAEPDVGNTIPQLIRHFPDTEVVGRDLPSLGVPRQRNSIGADSLTAKTARCAAPLGRNSLLCVDQGVPLPSSAVASDLISWSRWCGRRTQLGDQHQDLLEHLSRHRDVGHPKGRVVAVAHDLGADFDQFLTQASQRPRFRRLGHRARVRTKLPRL